MLGMEIFCPATEMFLKIRFFFFVLQMGAELSVDEDIHGTQYMLAPNPAAYQHPEPAAHIHTSIASPSCGHKNNSCQNNNNSSEEVFVAEPTKRKPLMVVHVGKNIRARQHVKEWFGVRSTTSKRKILHIFVVSLSECSIPCTPLYSANTSFNSQHA